MDKLNLGIKYNKVCAKCLSTLYNINKGKDDSVENMVCPVCLSAELDILRKAYAVTNESWKKLAGENEQLRQEQAGYRDTLEYAKDAIFQDDCSCHGFKKCLRCEALELVDKALGVGE
jgi:hypothetical protein